jgi:hypothetical protein
MNNSGDYIRIMKAFCLSALSVFIMMAAFYLLGANIIEVRIRAQLEERIPKAVEERLPEVLPEILESERQEEVRQIVDEVLQQKREEEQE